MKCLITYERINPTTTQGYMIKVTHLFSSYNQKGINNLEKKLEKSINTGLTIKGGEDKE